MVEAATESFRDAVERRLGLLDDVEPTPDTLAELPRVEREALRDDFVERFERGATRRVQELRGDGLLEAAEASAALSDERELRLESVADVLDALAVGKPPPPRRRDFDDVWSFLRASVRYVAVERNDWRDWAILVGAVLAGFGAALGVLKLSKAGLGEHGGSRLRRSLRTAVKRLHGPLYVMFAAGGLALGMNAVWLPSPVSGPTWIALQALIFLAVFWVGWRFTSAVTERVGDWATPEGESPGEQVLEIARKLLRLGLIVLFLFVGVELIFGTDLTALVAGLGIVGLGVTLAAQDTLKDLIAAVTLHVNRPFVRGDKIRYAGFFGAIEDIGFRMTRLRTLDGHLVTVPNAKLVSDAVENVDARPYIRRRFQIDLPYDTPVERISRAVDLVRETIEGIDGLDGADDPQGERGVQVHFDELGPHSLKLLVQYYYEEGDYWAAKAKDTEVDLALVERFREEDLDFAFPTQTLHVHRENGDADPEADEEPAEDPDERDAD